ncbi:hypothetical protein [Pseudomonas sp. FSL W5-0299]|uniref:DUF6966 domain-containing protein n=1 Tax=Pseudomonas sp. FSL W5-0299 TaxID=1917484 RepID=UPI00098AFF3C|nr:hypothetical protein [Pseudomonas sp. FSL W5-0299]OOL36098.1 hypothetical protein BOO94_19840 [Pseudomonas sp. FSL W5-0299]
MTKLDDTDAVLKRMIELLRIGAFDDWAVELEKITMNFDGDPKSKSSKLLSLYGGMGSLNDVVFYKKGQPLIAENNEFETLRIQLYELCKKLA